MDPELYKLYLNVLVRGYPIVEAEPHPKDRYWVWTEDRYGRCLHVLGMWPKGTWPYNLLKAGNE